MIPFVTERREGIGGDFIVKRHSLCVDGVLRDIRKTRVLQQESSSTTSMNANVRTSRKHAENKHVSPASFLHGNESHMDLSCKLVQSVEWAHPEEAVCVLCENGVSTIICVRIRHGFDSCSQQLIP